MNLTKYFHQPIDYHSFDVTQCTQFLLDDEQDYLVVDYRFALSVDEYSELIEEGHVGMIGGNLILFNLHTNQIERFTLWTNEFEPGEPPSFYVCFNDDENDDYVVYLLEDLIEYNEQTIEEKVTRTNLVAYQNKQTQDIFVFHEPVNKFNDISFHIDAPYLMQVYMIKLANGVVSEIIGTISKQVVHATSTANVFRLEDIFWGSKTVYMTEKNEPFILVELNNVTYPVWIGALFR